ncbi:hypothetical protein [Mangrovibacterium diazotrophicum]|uniref:Uncharacterized protein n=1 Tax=Mangrovibacterium diazotrophicum TaxID=1261403 RepID=A0A419WAV2_9BACT|nr:hypothetical protein [Mangrovibacterium diazotrophicum]RKD92598.1 hypothetical protein BC643_2973 [Mangrovibacterium diazotrophicum]
MKDIQKQKFSQYMKTPIMFLWSVLPVLIFMTYPSWSFNSNINSSPWLSPTNNSLKIKNLFTNGSNKNTTFSRRQLNNEDYHPSVKMRINVQAPGRDGLSITDTRIKLAAELGIKEIVMGLYQEFDGKNFYIDDRKMSIPDFISLCAKYNIKVPALKLSTTHLDNQYKGYVTINDTTLTKKQRSDLRFKYINHIKNIIDTYGSYFDEIYIANEAPYYYNESNYANLDLDSSIKKDSIYSNIDMLKACLFYAQSKGIKGYISFMGFRDFENANKEIKTLVDDVCINWYPQLLSKADTLGLHNKTFCRSKTAQVTNDIQSIKDFRLSVGKGDSQILISESGTTDTFEALRSPATITKGQDQNGLAIVMYFDAVLYAVEGQVKSVATWFYEDWLNKDNQIKAPIRKFFGK